MAAAGRGAKPRSGGGHSTSETREEWSTAPATAPVTATGGSSAAASSAVAANTGGPTIGSPGRAVDSMRQTRRRRTKPLLTRHSSLADLAREHKLKSRNSSTDDTRKFFSRNSDEERDIEVWEREEQANDSPDSPAFVLHHSSGVSTPEDPNFLYRTGSHVFMLAGHELGDSRHNSPIHSAAHSTVASRDVSSDDSEVDEEGESSSESSNAERVIQFEMQSSVDSSSEGISDDDLDADANSLRPVLWNVILRDVLGFSLKKPASAEAKRKDREKTTGVFDPALALALAATYIF